MNLTKKSVFLSFVLRHKPEEIGVTLNSEGWTNIDTLITQAGKRNEHFTKEMITQIVSEDKKGRYQISEDGLEIRAVQGHSTKMVDLTFTEKIPPTKLYHGTSKRYLNSIQKGGLQPQTRQYVHLSADLKTANTVGMRHAKTESELVILEIDTKQMVADKVKFYLADNGVWLATTIPFKYISIR